MILLSILNVQRDDFCVVLRNVRDGIPSRGDEVADVKIDADVGGCALHGARESVRGGELIGVGGMVVPVEAHHDFVFLRVLIDARRHADVGGRGDVLYAHRLGHLESSLDFLIGEILAKTVVVGVKKNARIIELFANSCKVAERCLQPPLLQLLALQARRHHMSVKEFALAQPHLSESFDAGVERPVAKRVALRANLYSPNNRIDHGGAAKLPAPGPVRPHIPPTGASLRHVVK